MTVRFFSRLAPIGRDASLLSLRASPRRAPVKRARACWRGVGGAALIASAMTGGASAAAAPVHVHVRNEVPRFLAFYHAAASAHVTPAARWQLWKRDYGLAAVPPTAQGRALAHKRLDQVWTRYAALIPQFPRDEARAAAAARSILRTDAALLKSGSTPIDVNLVLFVGEFSGNAYTVRGTNGHPSSVYLPVEMSYARQRIALAHEFTHAIQQEVDHIHNGYLAPIGEIALMEGLAMHVSKEVVPGHKLAAYTPAAVFGPAWQRRCAAHRQAIFRGILPYLGSKSVTAVQRFSSGPGTTGLHDEVYCVGWELVGALLDHGYSFGRLVRIPEAQMPRFVERRIRAARAGAPAKPGSKSSVRAF